MVLAAAALAGAGGVAPAAAATYVYDVRGTFSDGTGFTGTFSFDDQAKGDARFTGMTIRHDVLGTLQGRPAVRGTGLGDYRLSLENDQGSILLRIGSPADDPGGAWRPHVLTGSSFYYDWSFLPRYLSAGAVTPAVAAGVPEPATWMMLVLGFGVIGVSLRRKTVLRFV